MNKKKETICIACSIFKAEIELLKNKADMPIKTKYLSSMLHMNPDVLDKEIKNAISKNTDKNIVLVFGDCSPNIENISGKKGIIRTKGINCIEILLGKELYRKLRKEGAFFLMPEWTMRWEEIFKKELGLTEDIARELMNDMHEKIIYIDTGQLTIPYDILKQIENFTGLKTEILTVDFKELKRSINGAIKNNSERE